jgi:uncharacterized protein YybS (DUF2232 family)
LLIVPAIVKKSLGVYLKRLDIFVWWYIAAVMLQVLLSTDVARMLYLLTPVFAVLWGIILNDLKFLTKYRLT